MLDLFDSITDFFFGIGEWFEEQDGWLKVLIIALVIALGAAGYFGFNAFRDITNPQATVTEQAEELQAKGAQALEDGRATLEEQQVELQEKAGTIRQQALDYAQGLLDKAGRSN